MSESSLDGLRSQILRNDRALKKSIDIIEGYQTQDEKNVDPANRTVSLAALKNAVVDMDPIQKRNDNLVQKFYGVVFKTDTPDAGLQDEAERLYDKNLETEQWISRGKQYIKDAETQRAVSQLQNTANDAAANPGAQTGQNADMNRLIEALQAQVAQNGHQNGNGHAQNGNGHGGNGTKLPKQELKKFSGDLLEWKAFWQNFENAVDKNDSLQDIQKLNYLLPLLTDTAQDAVKGLSIAGENYAIAVNLLKTRFGNEAMIMQSLHAKFASLEPAGAETRSLRKLLDTVECILRSMEAQGERLTDAHMVSTVLCRLPTEVATAIQRQKLVDNNWDQKSFLDCLRREVMSRETVESYLKMENGSENGGTSTGSTMSSGARKKGGKKPPSRNNDDRKSDVRKYPCVFCGADHFPTECSKYKNVAERKARVSKRCYVCLSDKHFSKECRSRRPCYYCHDRQKHHSSLCPKQFSSEEKKEEPDPADKGKTAPETEMITHSASENTMLTTSECTVLRTMKVDIETSHGDVKERALLDCCSTRSYISQSLAQKLKLRTKAGPTLIINRFGSKKQIEMPTKEAEIKLKFYDESELLVNVTVVPEITGNIQKCPVTAEKVHKIARTLKLADDLPAKAENAPVNFLLGNDYYEEVLTGGKIKIENGLYFLGSRAGWILSGRMTEDGHTTVMSFTTMSSQGMESVSGTTLHCQTVQRMPHKPDLEDLWALESIGITDKPSKLEDEDREALENFENTIQHDSERYHVTLPWRDTNVPLKDNYGLALGRLKSLTNKLGRDPDLLKQYSEIISKQLEKEMIEEVKENEHPDHLVHYIPHHCVIEPERETTKVRIVYDGSAKIGQNSISLNESLLRGPVLLDDLAGLLMRFRLHEIGIVADIEKAFLQVGIQMPDRDVTRFLWLKDPTKPTIENNVAVYRFTRVPFGLNCSPFLLEATVDHHLKVTEGEFSDRIRRNKYVDNLICGTETEQEALRFYNESKKTFQSAGMNLRQFATNNKSLQKQIPTKDLSAFEKTKVLGVKWDQETDELVFEKVPEQNVKTKRDIVSWVSSIFDPLGLILPITISAKILMQDSSATKKRWDDPLPENLLHRFEAVKKQQVAAKGVKLPRKVSHSGQAVKYDLLCFCDASTQSYATSIYLRSESENKTTVSLVFAKNKLKPHKECTVPRLELLAVLIGVRATRFVQNELKKDVQNTYIWTDSQIVLSWLNKENKQGTFVDNRLREIRDKGKNMQFMHVSTSENPADLATRSNSLTELPELWKNGPDWAVKEREKWPGWNNRKRIQQQNEATEVANVVTRSQKRRNSSPYGIEITNFSSLKKLFRVTAWCHRFCQIIKRKRCSKEAELENHEIETAKLLWEKHEQKLCDDKQFESIKKQLGAFVDESGVIRCRGRLAYAPLSFDEKFPKLMPTKSYLTKLIIADRHKKTLHGGIAHTVAEIRKEYWIPRVRRSVQAEIRRCTICRRFEAKSYGIRPMADLPKERMTESPAFTHTGVDYFGPLYVKTETGTKKVWVCLFTCLVVRAVHLEMVHDMTSAEFMMALRRFIARYRQPKMIISDHGSQFAIAEEALQELWRTIEISKDLKRFCADKAIEWKRITPNAPWEGGVYERMVQTVKRPLRRVLGKLLLSAQELETLLLEMAAMVNSRPLTPINESPEDGFEILRPSDFLTQNGKTGLSDGTDGSVTGKDAVKKVLNLYKTQKQHLQLYWQLWRSQYLLSLREKWQKKQKFGVQEPEKDDIVIVGQDDLSRGSWKIAKVQAVHRGKDKECRSVDLLLPNGQVVTRSVRQVYPLELPDHTRK